MSGESSSARSDLIDVTYSQLHSILSGYHEGLYTTQISSYLTHRKPQLSNLSSPFGSPSDASSKQIHSGNVVLPDGITIRVDSAERAFVLAISDRFSIDEVQALVLLRSFLYNEGLPPTADASSTESMKAELLEAITPFYFSERLALFRTYIPLFRANENSTDPMHAVASEILPQLVPDSVSFATALLTTYSQRLKEGVPPSSMQGDLRKASRWAKQNRREQLVLLEVLFWAMWGYVSCSGPMVEQIYDVAYATNLGSSSQQQQQQSSAPFLLDEEGEQLRQDCAAMWILIMVEVLELEGLGDPEAIDISANPANKDTYLASPQSLLRIHELVVSRSESTFVLTYLAWAYVLSRLTAKATHMLQQNQSIPAPYKPFFDLINVPQTQSQGQDPHATRYSRTTPVEQVHVGMMKSCLSENAGLFRLLKMLLTQSPLFVTALAWRTGSSVTDPNAIAFRSVIKGLIISLVELTPVEHIPSLDAFIDIWVTLFGRSEAPSVAGICAQFWESDWKHPTSGVSRRAIIDVCRSRFPVHVQSLVRLLRAMTGAGFLGTDELSPTDFSTSSSVSVSRPAEGEEDSISDLCARFVFHYFENLPTYTQVIPVNLCSGPHALYERVQERNGTQGPGHNGMVYHNLKPLKLPGGSILPIKSSGRLLSGDGGEYVVVVWQHEHSGWKLVLEVLTDYVNRRLMQSGSAGGFQELSFGKKRSAEYLTLRLEDVGVEIPEEGDEEMIIDCLDLVWSLVRDNPGKAERLMRALESGEPVVSHTMLDSTQPPDLVQLTIMILEEAMARTDPRNSRSQLRTKLITSAMSVLAALLALPHYSNRVWLFLRSTTALFSNEKTVGLASVALGAERATGHYTMTLALLHLVQQLFQEASTSYLPSKSNARLQQLKEEVLLRAARFVHTEIWIEHLGWKYAQLGDRFEIGRRCATLYVSILEYSPPNVETRPFAALSQSVTDAFLFKAANSTLSPLVTAIATGRNVLRALYATRRFEEARTLLFLLQSCLQLTRAVLNMKLKSTVVGKACLLEQSLCKLVSDSGPVESRARIDPVEVLAGYIKERDVGTVVPVESARVLSALCASLSAIQPHPPTTVIGHLSSPETTVASLVRIIQHPYDEMVLRNAVWHFIALAVDKEPALAGLFVVGKFRSPSELRIWSGVDSRKGKAKDDATADSTSGNVSALSVARDVLSNWKDMMDANPQLLSSVLRFVDVVWKHGLEHKAALDPVRKNPQFWKQLVGIINNDLGPEQDLEMPTSMVVDRAEHSALHELGAARAYRAQAKAYAVNIISLDIGNELQLQVKDASKDLSTPMSFQELQSCFKERNQLQMLLEEAAPSPYSPKMYDELMRSLQTTFEGLDLEQLRIPESEDGREFGDNFVFSAAFLKSRLRAYAFSGEQKQEQSHQAEQLLMLVNLNMSLTHTQTALTESWQSLLRQVVPFLKGDAAVRSTLLSIASYVSCGIADEKRSGDMMATIHRARLSLLLAILELAWFSTKDSEHEIESFIQIVRNVHNITLNEAQPPADSVLGRISTPFHRVLLQIIYFCARHGRSLARRPKTLKAEQRLTLLSMVESTLNFVIDALHAVFMTARTVKDAEVDKDMELLVTVFEQCTRKDLNPSSTLWLARCQEADVIGSSLELFRRIDIVGLSDLPLLVLRKQPLYVPHILLFHMALVSNPTAAERLASDGVLSAYSNNSISTAISRGLIDVAVPELPGERSPAHVAYCIMLAIVAAVISSLGSSHHYFEAEAAGFVQLYGNQLSRALSWTVGDPITWPLLEEMEQVIALFYAIANSTPRGPKSTHPVVENILRAFTTSGLKLLQQINYAITHPNHLASLLEPVTNEERLALEKELNNAPADADPLKRPLILQMIHRLFKLSSNVITTLLTISRSDSVLLSPQDDWPLQEAVVVPHSKIVPGEPASIGTLLELGNCTLDVLRDLVNRPSGQSILPAGTLPTRSVEPGLDVRQGVRTARKTLETALTYAVTQLAMWLRKPDFEPSTVSGGESMNMDGAADDERMEGKELHRSTHTRKSSLAERVRRGMTGEIASDLQTLITKSKPTVEKADEMLKATDGKGSDLLNVLGMFLQEKVIIPAS